MQLVQAAVTPCTEGLRHWEQATAQVAQQAAGGQPRYSKAAPFCRAEALSRRALLVGAVAAAMSAAFSAVIARPSCAGGGETFREYVSAAQQYRIGWPVSWEQTGKAGADVLFVDLQRKSTNVGVTVSPIRIASLEQFGGVETVAERLLAAERAKESTKAVTLVSQDSRRGASSGQLIYDFDYELDSSRGRKRILSTVAIANRKLYIVNGTFKCDMSDCSDAAAALGVMQRMAQSFDVIS